MRSTAILLLLSSLIHSIPLQVGSSLRYRVWRGWESESTLVTLQVQKDSLTDSGTIWTIGIRDSLPNGTRVRATTAVVRATALDTVWQTPSCLAAWDLTGSDPTPDSGIYTGTGNVPPRGGILAAACFGSGSPDKTTWRVRTGYNPVSWENGRRALGMLVDLRWFDPPAALRIPVLGLVRLRDTISKEDWKLVEVDGGIPPGISRWDSATRLLADLRIGESWTWVVEDSSDQTTKWGNNDDHVGHSAELTWIVMAVDEDSSGWIRRTIRSRCQLDSLSDSALFLRMDPISGEIRVSKSAEVLERLAQGMAGRWSDVGDVNGDFRRSVTTDLYGSIESRSDSLLSISRAGIGPVLFRHAVRSRISMSSSSSRVLQIRLRNHDGEALGVENPRRRRSDPSTKPLSLAEIREVLEVDPSTTLRIVDLSGRVATGSALEGLASLRSRVGIVYVELRGSGRIRSGRLILP